MRIAYVHDQLLPTNDTAVEQLINTINGLVHNGVEGTLFLPRSMGGDCPDPKEVMQYYDVDALFELRCLRSAFPSSRVPEKIAHALRLTLHRSLRAYDVVYTRNIPFLFSATAAGLPVVYETYRPWPTQYPALAPLFRRAMKARNFLGAVLHSEYARKEYLQIGVPPERVMAIHNGYAPGRFEPRLSSQDAKAALGLPTERLAVGYTGRLLPGKGMSIVLEMARRRPKILFLLVGSDGKGEVEEQAAAMENVRVFGWQRYDQLPRYLFASDILLIPPTLLALQQARNTVLPMKLFLYLGAGRSILAPKAPDTAELLVHRKNAILVEPDDVEQACAGLDQLADDHQRAQIEAGVHQTARGLTWDARARRIVEFINSRIAQR